MKIWENKIKIVVILEINIEKKSFFLGLENLFFGLENTNIVLDRVWYNVTTYVQHPCN